MEGLIFDGQDDQIARDGDGAYVLADIDTPDSRSRIQEKPDGAKVLWTKGDTFRTHFIDAGKYYYTDFRTDDDGVSSAVFRSKADLTGEDFVCIYPGFNDSDHSTGTRLYEVLLPATQKAVAGGIEEGLNRSMAFTKQFVPGTKLYFQNMLSLVKFRMEGKIAGQIRSVRLTATSQITGSHVAFWDDGKPGTYPGCFRNAELTPYAVLEGEFEAGKDYYFALWPATTSGFEMQFSDGDGHYSTYQSSKTITFSRSDITDFGTIVLGDDFVGDNPGAVSTEPELYYSATEGTKPVTIVIVPEGFTLTELPQYERLARMGLDYVFDTEPYRSYKDRFNAYILKVPSNESGISITDGKGNITRKRDSYFGVSRANDSYDDLDANSTRVFDFVKNHCPDILDGVHTIQDVPIIILTNDARYGANCHSFPDGRSYCIVPHCLAGASLQWNYPSITPSSEENSDKGYKKTEAEEIQNLKTNTGDWKNIFLHEFSHAIGRLQDEYWKTNNKINSSLITKSQAYAVPFGMNVSISYDSPPWQELLDRRNELMDINPLYGRIGVYQGGANAMYNIWRSEKISCMIDNRPYFSAWQRYLIVQRIMTLSGDAELFNFDLWLAKDDPTDPLRDGISTRSSFDWENTAAQVYPMTPLPIINDD